MPWSRRVRAASSALDRGAGLALDSETPAWLRSSMNPSTGNGGTCYGDSGGPNFLGLYVPLP